MRQKNGTAGIGKPEFKVSVQVDQTGKANGQELHLLEILSYDPIKKIHTSSGFSSDGSPWTLTATFDDARVTEEGVSKGPDGQATTCQTTWSFSSDRKSLSGTQECKQNGVRWTAFCVKGTKSTTAHWNRMASPDSVIPKYEHYRSGDDVHDGTHGLTTGDLQNWREHARSPLAEWLANRVAKRDLRNCRWQKF